MNSNLLDYYFEKLDYKNMPKFLVKYLDTPCLKRLKKIGYFCGMDYASKNIYNFKEYITRYDHSLTVALLTWKCTHDKESTLAGLFHDISTPCFSHVIDYMNKDYENQESTEQYTEDILKNDKYLIECLKQDNINVEDIINFKKYSIVDNERPKLCADRLDGVILTGMSWTKNIQSNDIDNILNDLDIFDNEIGFRSKEIAYKVVEVSKSIDIYCHSNEDNYMMELLATITRYGINKGYITYKELYISNEEDVLNKLKNTDDAELLNYINKFENITESEISAISLEDVKKRDLNPLVKGKRLNKF